MRFFDYDPHTGVTQTFKKDGGKVIIASHKDIQPTLDACQKQRSIASGDWKGDWHHVASVDPMLLEMWREELKAQGYPNTNPLAKENHKWFIAKLNSRDFTKVRTKEGNI